MALLLIGAAGYVGSSLYSSLIDRGAHVDTVDLCWFGPAPHSANICADYGGLDRDFLRRYETIVLLAGHSSVAMCQREPERAIANNVSNFASLLSKLDDNQRLLYASSISVYGTDAASDECSEGTALAAPVNHYDFHKQAIDHLARLSGVRYYGLRFGTVNGPSSNLRVDIMLNKMVHIARRRKRIEFCNPTIYRPILGIADLCRAVIAITEHYGEPGVYNLASFNATVGEMACQAASIVGVPAIATPDSPGAYNVKVSTKKFQAGFGFRFYDTTETILESLKTSYDHCVPTIRI